MSTELSQLDRPLTLKEAADYLQKPARTVRELCTRKKITHAKLDYRTYRFSRADLNDFIAKRTLVAR